MTRDEQFSAITALVLRYETGDFLLLSDLSDAISALKDFFLEDNVSCAVIESINRCVAEEMKQSGNIPFTEIVSSGIDLLQRYADAPDS